MRVIDDNTGDPLNFWFEVEPDYFAVGTDYEHARDVADEHPEDLETFASLRRAYPALIDVTDRYHA